MRNNLGELRDVMGYAIEAILVDSETFYIFPMWSRKLSLHTAWAYDLDVISPWSGNGAC